MRRIAWLLLMMMVLLGCDTQPEPQRSKPIPPDDMSNEPWKNRQRQRAGQQQAAGEAQTPAEPN